MRCRPRSSRRMKTGTTGASVRRAITARPRDVEAGVPKKGAKIPSARVAFWSSRIPTMRPRRSASRTSGSARRLLMSSAPVRRRSRSTTRSSRGWSSGRSTTERGRPVRGWAAARSSQLPRCAVRRSTPRPCTAASFKCSRPSISTRRRKTSEGRNRKTQTSIRFMPRCSKDRRPMWRSSASPRSARKARRRLSRAIARRRASRTQARSPRRRPSHRPSRGGRWATAQATGTSRRTPTAATEESCRLIRGAGGTTSARRARPREEW